MPAPSASEGEKVPLVTTPASSPPARTGLPPRGMPAPSIRNGARRCAVPPVRSRATASEPRKPAAAAQHQPRPASVGAGVDRGAVGGVLVAVQGEAGLEAQGVARAEPAGDDSGLEQLDP